MEHSADFHHVETLRTTAAPERVFALWSDPSTWASWDPPVERVVLDGPFRVGTSGTMVMAGGFEMPFELLVVSADERYLDVIRMGELEIRIDHVVEAVDGGSLVTVTTDITGPGAEGIGSMVTADAPTALAALVAMAESPSPTPTVPATAAP
jgi:uncharacterized protein YndB with AHSA1/START domain